MAAFMITGAKSGSGKTMVTCGLLNLFKQKGLNPAAVKCGPDYIDPLFHSRVLGVESTNIDPFFETREQMEEKYREVARDHLVIFEGAMGYFDGLGGTSLKASAYEVAKVLGLPAVLVIDTRGSSLSAAAVIGGFLDFDAGGGWANNGIEAVILNRVSESIYPALKAAIEERLPVRVAGYIPVLDFLDVPSRHLGLVLPGEVAGFKEKMDRLAESLSRTIDWEYLSTLGAERMREGIAQEKKRAPLGSVKIGVAWDEAFCFYYKDNLKCLREAGAELIFFSPLKDKALPEGVCGLILGGGYPELYARILSANRAMREEIAAKARAGLPVLAECGGYLYLLDELEGADSGRYPMAGIFKGSGQRSARRGRFGYVTVTAKEDTPYLEEGETIKGHEFHYWDCACNVSDCCMEAVKPVGERRWACMRRRWNVLAGFAHLYYPSNERFTDRFMTACRSYMG